MTREVFLVPYQIDACWIEHLARRRLLRWDGGCTGHVALAFSGPTDAAMARLTIGGEVAAITDESDCHVLLVVSSGQCPTDILDQIENLGIEFQAFEAILIDADDAEIEKISGALEDFRAAYSTAQTWARLSPESPHQ